MKARGEELEKGNLRKGGGPETTCPIDQPDKKGVLRKYNGRI